MKKVNSKDFSSAKDDDIREFLELVINRPNAGFLGITSQYNPLGSDWFRVWYYVEDEADLYKVD